jgi:hypothetical protein
MRLIPSLPVRTPSRAGAAEPKRLRLGLLLLAVATSPWQLAAQQLGVGGEGYFFHRPALTISVRGGADRPIGSSQIWDFTTQNLTVSKGDFTAPGFMVDVGVRLSDRFQLIAASGTSRRANASEFRKYVDNNDLPIEQTTTIRRLPVMLGVRYNITAPEERISRFAWIPSRVTPWVGVGGGAMNYTFSQIGDFVDFQTLNVFKQTFASSGWAPMAYGNVGVDLKLSMRFSLTGDFRYSAARATLGGKFVGFDKIDLSGTAATMGLTVRM